MPFLQVGQICGKVFSAMVLAVVWSMIQDVSQCVLACPLAEQQGSFWGVAVRTQWGSWRLSP